MNELKISIHFHLCPFTLRIIILVRIDKYSGLIHPSCWNMGLEINFEPGLDNLLNWKCYIYYAIVIHSENGDFTWGRMQRNPNEIHTPIIMTAQNEKEF